MAPFHEELEMLYEETSWGEPTLRGAILSRN